MSLSGYTVVFDEHADHHPIIPLYDGNDTITNLLDNQLQPTPLKGITSAGTQLVHEMRTEIGAGLRASEGTEILFAEEIKTDDNSGEKQFSFIKKRLGEVQEGDLAVVVMKSDSFTPENKVFDISFVAVTDIMPYGLEDTYDIDVHNETVEAIILNNLVVSV